MKNTLLKNTKKILLALPCGLASMVNTIANNLAQNSAQTRAEH